MQHYDILRHYVIINDSVRGVFSRVSLSQNQYSNLQKVVSQYPGAMYSETCL